MTKRNIKTDLKSSSPCEIKTFLKHHKERLCKRFFGRFIMV